MKLDRTLISLDLESIGLNPMTDRIVQVGVHRILPGGVSDGRSWLVNPGVPIPPEATECHGITDAMVKGLPSFGLSCREIFAYIGEPYDLVGFNCLQFDILIMLAEIERACFDVVFPHPGCRIIDVSVIFKKKEERTLEAAVRRFCGREHKGAHNALADAEETHAVLLGQLASYPDLANMSIDELAAFSKFDGFADFAGKLRRDKDGALVYNIGQSRGKKVLDDPGMAYWMLDRDFPSDTKALLREELKKGELI